MVEALVCHQSREQFSNTNHGWLMAADHTTVRTEDCLIYFERFLRDQTPDECPCHSGSSSKTRTARSSVLFDLPCIVVGCMVDSATPRQRPLDKGQLVVRGFPAGLPGKRQ